MPRRKRRPVRLNKLKELKTTKEKQYEVMDSSSHSVSTTNLNHQVYHVPSGSLEESPSRYLIQVAHPSTLEPEMRHEETEVEKSMSNHSNQMEGQNTLEVECVPLEKEPLANDTKTSNNFEERANNNHDESISMVGPTSLSLSFKLTEMVNMWDDEDDDEVNSVRQSSPMDTVEGYKVKPEFMPILRKIITKHGDIGKSCVVSTMRYPSMLMEMICEIILELNENNFSKVKEDNLHNMIALVNEIKNINVDIEWLHMRLVEILEAKQVLKQSSILKDERESNSKIIEIVEGELKECEAQKKAVAAKLQSLCNKERVCKETLARAKDESIRIAAAVTYAKYKVKRFLHSSLADYLL